MSQLRENPSLVFKNWGNVPPPTEDALWETNPRIEVRGEPCGQRHLSAGIGQETWGAAAQAKSDYRFDDELQDRSPLSAQASGRRQHPLDEPGTFFAVRAEASLAPQNGGPDFLFARVVRRFDVGESGEDPKTTVTPAEGTPARGIATLPLGMDIVNENFRLTVDVPAGN